MLDVHFLVSLGARRGFVRGGRHHSHDTDCWNEATTDDPRVFCASQDSFRAVYACEVGGRCPLQLTSTTKGECYYTCFRNSEHDVLRSLSDRFDRKQRLAVIDGDGSPAVAIRALSLDTGMVTWHTSCEIHQVANFMEAVAKPFRDDISCMIGCQLSLQSAGSMRHFRDIVRRHIASKLVYRKGHPEVSDMRFARACMDQYLPAHKKTNRLARAILETMLNGRWEDHQEITHRCSGCCADEDDCKRKLASFVIAILCGVAPNVWPRHRWRGSRTAINWMCLLQAAHGLLGQCYLEWSAAMRGGAWVANAPCGGAHVQGDSGLGAAPPGGQAAADSIASGLDKDIEDAVVGAGPDAPDVDQVWAARRLQQSKFRFASSCWFMHRAPEPRLIVLRQVLGPLEDLMESYIAQAGPQSEEKQQAEAATFAAASSDGDLGIREWVASRDFRTMLAVEHTLTDPVIAEVNSLRFEAALGTTH